MIIEKGLTNESSRKSIADTLGKDKSTICKEVKKHRRLKEPSRSYRSPNGTHDCIFIRECGYNGFYHSACAVSLFPVKEGTELLESVMAAPDGITVVCLSIIIGLKKLIRNTPIP